MLSSPFQQPSRRQNALVLQIQEARTAGDEALLSRLISQWVHRYGFNGAAELDLTLPEPSASTPEFSSTLMPVAEVEIAPDVATLVEHEAVAEHEVVSDEETTVEEEEIAAEETLPQRSVPAAPAPAPPISTPRSLQR